MQRAQKVKNTTLTRTTVESWQNVGIASVIVSATSKMQMMNVKLFLNDLLKI